MRATMRRFLKDSGGATAIEYGLIVGLISLAIVGAIGSTGGSVETLWNDNANKIADAMK